LKQRILLHTESRRNRSRIHPGIGEAGSSETVNLRLANIRIAESEVTDICDSGDEIVEKSGAAAQNQLVAAGGLPREAEAWSEIVRGAPFGVGPLLPYSSLPPEAAPNSCPGLRIQPEFRRW